MNLKQYTAQPDPGLFDTIQRRLRRRRLLRRAGVLAAVALVAGVAALLVVARPDTTVAAPQMASLQPDARPAIAPAAPASQPAAAVADPMQPQPAAAASSDPSRSNLQPPTSDLRAPSPKPDIEHLPSQQPHPIVPPALPSSSSAMAEVPSIPSVLSADPSHSNLQPPTSDLRPPTSDLRPPTSDLRPPISDLRAPAPKSEVETTDVNVWAPNVIIPDGDQEENRTFSLRFSDEVTDFKLYIFNRNGRQLAYSNDPAYRWDATHGGSRLPQGTYVWSAQFRDSEGRPVQKKGTVTVLR